MAEQGLARQMMAQRLMTEKRDDPFSDSRFFVGKMRPSLDDIENPTRFSDMAMPAYATGATASLFAPGAGVTDIMGFAPDPAQPGEFLPSFGENIAAGNYLDAGLQTLGGAGDVMMAGGTIIPPLALIGTTLKAPRAARVAGQAVDAAKNVDEARAALEASPNDPVLKQQYLDLRRQRDAQLSQMSASEQLELDVSYRMDHQPRGPQDGGGRLDDITAGGELFPDDVYSADGLRFYGNPNNASDRQSYAAIMAARGNPDAEITIYRAVPQDVDQINPGDWVTLSPEYASIHAASGYGPDGQQAGKVISQRVRVKDVYSDGNDLNEFGFFPSELADAGVKKIVPPTETEPGIIAFHGSGADFDEFRLEMIGTGEGAQAYGYGLYFTDSEDIAKFYKDAVGGSGLQLPSGQRFRFTTQGDVDDLFEVLNVPFRAGLGSDPNATNMSLIEDFSKIRLGGGAVAEFRKQPFDTRERVLDAYANDISNHMIEAIEETDDPAAGVKYLRELADSDRYDVYERSKRYVQEDRARVERAMVLEAANQLELLVNKGFKKLQTGKMYKVALQPKPGELLDFDLPLSQQPDAIQEKAKGVLSLLYPDVENPALSMSGGDLIRQLEQRVDSSITNAMTQQRFIVEGKLEPELADNNRDAVDRLVLSKVPEGARLNTQNGQKIASEILQDLGIPGIKYRASGSRGAGVTDEAAERNYVIFDDSAIKILEKYGIIGPVLVTGGAVAATQRGGDEEGSIFPDA